MSERKVTRPVGPVTSQGKASRHRSTHWGAIRLISQTKAIPHGFRLIAIVLVASAQLLASSLNAQASMSFSVQATNWRILSVPQYQQQHGLTCEAAALRMALGAFGLNVAESTLMSQIGIDYRLPYWDSSGGFHWGDPYAAFVGNPDGSERGLTGYGVYYPPIARVAQANGAVVSQASEGIAPSTIYQAVFSIREMEVEACRRSRSPRAGMSMWPSPATAAFRQAVSMPSLSMSPRPAARGTDS